MSVLHASQSTAIVSSNKTFIKHVSQYNKIWAGGDLETDSRTCDLDGVYLGEFVDSISAMSYKLC